MADRQPPTPSPSPSSSSPSPDRLDAIAALGEPTRRALYDYVAATGGWVSRDQAADAVGVGRGTAAHHLDRLAAGGLLDVDYRRVSGRRGPGAGRPAKLYRRARRDLGVTLPPRDYELAGRLLADAVDRTRVGGVDIQAGLDEAALAEGRRAGEEVRARWPDRAPVDALPEVLLDVLEQRGYEPRLGDDGTVVLTNCPFHRLAREHTDLVCGLNLRLLAAALDDLGGTGLAAHLEPTEGVCCVRLRPRPGRRGRPGR
jgi:predicted ArsR family transcriptional regulator